MTVVAMTAHAFEGDREKCLQAGMDDYLAKPVRVAELARMLSRWDPPLKAALVDELAATAGKEFRAMAEVFIAHAGESIRGVAAGLARGDGEAVHALTHGLRGSAGSFGAIGIVALAEAVEEALQRGALEEARAAAAEFPDELARAARALRSL